MENILLGAKQLDRRMVSILAQTWAKKSYVYPNIYSHESVFLFEGSSTTWFNYKPNKRKAMFFRTDILLKTAIFIKLAKNPVIN